MVAHLLLWRLVELGVDFLKVASAILYRQDAEQWRGIEVPKVER